MFLDFLYATLAALFFALLFNVPKKAAPIAGILGGIGYWIFLTVSSQGFNSLFAFFIGTSVVTILSEIAARIMKLATTTFISISIIPLVPGLGLYQTMFSLVQNDYQLALSTGIYTMLAAGSIAMSVAITTLLYRFGDNLFFKTKKER